MKRKQRKTRGISKLKQSFLTVLKVMKVINLWISLHNFKKILNEYFCTTKNKRDVSRLPQKILPCLQLNPSIGLKIII